MYYICHKYWQLFRNIHYNKIILRRFNINADLMQLVSLTTDYGSKDFYVADLKAAILSKYRDTMLIDISHHIDHFDILQAAFFVKNALASFPAGTIHIIAVNCNYKRKSEFICYERDGHFFVGPNNGVFSLIFEDFDIYALNCILRREGLIHQNSG